MGRGRVEIAGDGNGRVGREGGDGNGRVGREGGDGNERVGREGGDGKGRVEMERWVEMEGDGKGRVWVEIAKEGWRWEGRWEGGGDRKGTGRAEDGKAGVDVGREGWGSPCRTKLM